MPVFIRNRFLSVPVLVMAYGLSPAALAADAEPHHTPPSRVTDAAQFTSSADIPVRRESIVPVSSPNSLSDREPEDPAEFRPQRMPPARPAARGGGSVWESLGPAPTESAQVRVPPDNEVSGAVQSIAVHPTDPNVIYIGSVNGGIWKTTNGTVARPTWEAQTADLPSQSIGAIEFDPSDPTRQTLIAGIGRWSNFARRGDDELGVYRTVNGGASWTLLGGNTLLGKRMSAVSARGSTLMATSLRGGGGLFRSVDTGANWSLVSGTGGLPTGNALDMAADSSNNNRFYIAIDNSAPTVLRSEDGGVTWTDVTAGLSALGSSTNNIRISVGAAGVVYVVVVNSGRLDGVFRSPDLGATWVSMDVPSVHPGGQGSGNTAVAADPGDSDLVYISGDRISFSPFTGNIVRGDFSQPAGSQFVLAMDSGAMNTSPHADSRDMAFDANGDLLEASDGGIYRRTSPESSAGVWTSVIGNLNVMEVHDLAYDGVSDIIMIGTQDNGTHMQQTPTDPRWTMINGGDGGDAAIDDSSLGASGSFRYISSQNLGGFRRAQYSAGNAFQGNQSMPSIGDRQFVTPLELSLVDDSRLLIGGSSNIYESTNANGGAPTITSLGGPGANRNAMAYGAIGAPEAAYVGRSNAVHRRQGNAFVQTSALPAGAATITDVAMDPNDTDSVYAVDNNQVFYSDDGGVSWTDVTGNLSAISSDDYRTIEYMELANGSPALALGTRSGVYSSLVGSVSWAVFGSGLPDVLVFDLRYVPETRSLIAGTLGRGVWRLQAAAAISIDDVVANEGTGGTTAFTFTVTLTEAVPGGFSVPFNTADDSASAPSDYASNTGVLNFVGTANETQTITVQVVADAVLELEERFNVNLGTPSSASVSVTDSSGLGRILNDDSASVAIDDVSAAEGDSGNTAFTFTATVSGTVQGGFNLPFNTADGSATQPADYASASGTLNFTGGTNESRTITVQVVGDTTIEPDEAFDVVLGAPSNGTVSVSDGTGLGSIENDDNVGASISIGDRTRDERNSGNTPFVFAVTLTEDVPGGFSVPFSTADGSATEPSDYASADGVLSFNGTSGEVLNITVQVVADTVLEADETFSVNLGSPSSLDVSVTDDSGLGTISNDDSASISINDISEVEGSAGTTPFEFSVSLNNPVQGGFSVPFSSLDGSATEPADYASVNDVLSFAGTVGEVQTVAVQVVGDTAIESDENFRVNLGSPSNPAVGVSDNSGRATIIDDDDNAADIAVSVDDGRGTIPAGQSTVYVVEVSNTSTTTDVAAIDIAQTVPAQLESVGWTCVGSGGATCPANGNGGLALTVAIPANGSVTFQVSATVSAGTPPSTVATTVTATVQPPQTDPNGANNSATDSNQVVGDPLLTDGFETP